MRENKQGKNKFAYTFQIWIVTLLLGPICLALQLYFLKESAFLEIIIAYFPILSFSLIFSLPVLLITTISYIIFGPKINNAILLKSLLYLITVAGLVFTFLNFGAFTVNDLLPSYLISTTLAFLIVRIKKTDSIH